ncbi:cupin domain-containing protein [Parvularcula dongshanensis]|uniref:Mannose-6-phosphate isomerase-like protein (Cupin superfamily) n=1 Tax=Parvularcula dongshanensis TaxID=1173995 RepID=A0A840HY67_9PROT|nr:cupin domain-containing protein [Parvularcula dongshanensis]MBB4657796.1 mannose-6-phosphate isomerase-like protein (cupin superfamily) [Parvularcula dongshanensis]
MADKIEKLNAEDATPGSHGEAQMMAGAGMALREWNEGKTTGKDDHAQDYETLGYVIAGEAKLCSGDETLHLTQGDSWRVPKGVMHHYEVEESFRAVEVTSPPARGQALGGMSAS